MNVNTVKKEVESKIGKSVQIVVHGMRNKKSTYVGKIYKIYPNIFSINTDIGEKTFTYVDLCTGDITIKYLN